MNHRSTTKRVLALWLLPLALIAGMSVCSSQSQIQITIPSFDYDVIYLTDYIDFATQKLATSIPNFSGEIVNAGSTTQTFWLRAEAKIQLSGKGVEDLATVATENITLAAGARISLSSSDLRRGSTGAIQVKAGSAGYAEGAGKKSLEDAVSNSGQSTAPVGVYTIFVYAYPTPYSASPSTSSALGRASRTINVRNSSPNEVSVNLIDPQPGAVVPTTLPTFSWTSPNPKNTIYVYEKLPIHRSPQEAITGIPYLKKELQGASTLTYPTDAARRLEQNKSYYWFVETEVTTDRGSEKRRSEIQLFRIVLENPLARAVERLLGNLGSNVSGTYATLQSIGWIPNKVTLDGKVLSADELNALAGQLTELNVKEARAE